MWLNGCPVTHTSACGLIHSSMGKFSQSVPMGMYLYSFIPESKKKKKEKKCYDKRFKKKKKNSSLNHLSLSQGFPGSSADKESTSNGFDPWVGKMPWRKKWQPPPIFLTGKSHGRGVWWSRVHGVTKRVRHN